MGDRCCTDRKTETNQSLPRLDGAADQSESDEEESNLHGKEQAFDQKNSGTWPPKGMPLILGIDSGHDLRGSLSQEALDVYVKVKHEGCEFTTPSICSRNQAAFFNSSFALENVQPDHVLLLTVWDRAELNLLGGPDDLMGRLEISIQPYIRELMECRTVNLRRRLQHQRPGCQSELIVTLGVRTDENEAQQQDAGGGVSGDHDVDGVPAGGRGIRVNPMLTSSGEGEGSGRGICVNTLTSRGGGVRVGGGHGGVRLGRGGRGAQTKGQANDHGSKGILF